MFLNHKEFTVVDVSQVEYIEVGVVDGRGQALESHFIGVDLGGKSLVVDGGFGDVEKGVDEGPFSRMLVSQNDERSVFELLFGSGLIEELVPHDYIQKND